nr:TPA_inf: conotoxin precursor O2 [Conus ebraeus]
MEKLAILLLVAAVLMSTPALIQGGVEKRQMAKIDFSKRKSTAESWWEGECRGWSNGCTQHSQCCSGECIGRYCDIW